MQSKVVIKRDGREEPFKAEKLNRWAAYAAKRGGNWSEIAIDTYKRLPAVCSSDLIHQTMIDVCLDKESLEYSRVASRLELAGIRKNMDYILGCNDQSSLADIMDAYEECAVWDFSQIPEYNPEWEDWYKELLELPFEYWQRKQWADKYACRVYDQVVETPQLGFLGIALALFGDTKLAKDFAFALCKGQINLPTPALNGCRNGDYDTISCCLISAGDTTESIGVANEIAYRMTAKKAGIGIQFTTRSKDDPVKGGRVSHLGKWPIFKMVDRTVKCLTQITRGGNATVTVLALDPEIENIISWKTQRVDIKQRIDMLDYSFGYNDSFVQAVIKDEDWHLISYADAPHIHRAFYTWSAEGYKSLVQNALEAGVKSKVVKARDLLKKYLTARQETGRFYDINLSRMNEHTPFEDVIVQSNLCLEIALPTKPYPDMYSLYAQENSIGETAFCSLSAINVAATSDEEYEYIAELALRAVDIMIDRAPMMTRSMKTQIMLRRSVGMGIIGLAARLYKNGLDYNGSPESLKYVSELAERHYFYLLKASQKLAAESDSSIVEKIDYDWLPIDTLRNATPTLDWESLRGIPRKHSVLVAHMPTESSSLLSNAPNGLYPVRRQIVNKRSRKGIVQYICESFDPSKHLTAWNVDNITMSRYYGIIQDWTDQAISADFYFDPAKYPDGKKPMSELLKEWVAHAKFGNKTKYYLNTNDYNGGSIQDVKEQEQLVAEEDCESCKL